MGFVRLTKGFMTASRLPTPALNSSWLILIFLQALSITPTLMAPNFYLFPNFSPLSTQLPRGPMGTSTHIHDRAPRQLIFSSSKGFPDSVMSSYCPALCSDFTKLCLLSVLPSNYFLNLYLLHPNCPASLWPQHPWPEYSPNWFS